MGVEIHCPYCGKETFLRREAVYEGFRKTGERLFCAACGYEFPDEAAVPFKNRPEGPKLFDPAERPAAPRIFAEGENRRLCRYCAHYIVNPFTQFCSLHRREVEATDSCDRFASGGGDIDS